MFGIRPAYVKSNSTRANYAYGGAVVADTTAPGLLPKNSGASNSQFFPGSVDKGDVARACFYMATRYYVASAPTSTASLKLINTTDGTVPNGSMGDLNALLHFNYQDPVDNFERRHNQYIYKNPEQTSSTGNLSQGNRNPYVDHPEWVWSVFGDGANDSQITVGTPTTAGASAQAVNFGRVIVGGVAPALSTGVTINKTGADPTTFAVSTSGAATTDRLGNLNTFDYAIGTKTMTVGLTGVTTATAGVKSGVVTVDNTDITNQGAGTGALDGDDKVNLSLTVLDHSNASFDTAADTDTLVMNFQNVDLNKTASANFSISDLMSASGFTAGLDLDSIVGTGDTAAFATNLAAFNALAAGTAKAYSVSFTPTTTGVFYATYTLGVSDENLSGATTGNALTLILTGVASYATVPEPAALLVLPAVACLLMYRRRIAA